MTILTDLIMIKALYVEDRAVQKGTKIQLAKDIITVRQKTCLYLQAYNCLVLGSV